MKTNNEIRACVFRLAAVQLRTTPDKVTDETVLPNIQSLMFDACRDLEMVAGDSDPQHFLTVGDAIKAFTDKLPLY
jgi:hypothetical protein